MRNQLLGRVAMLQRRCRPLHRYTPPQQLLHRPKCLEWGCSHGGRGLGGMQGIGILCPKHVTKPHHVCRHEPAWTCTTSWPPCRQRTCHPHAHYHCMRERPVLHYLDPSCAILEQVWKAAQHPLEARWPYSSWLQSWSQKTQKDLTTQLPLFDMNLSCKTSEHRYVTGPATQHASPRPCSICDYMQHHMQQWICQDSQSDDHGQSISGLNKAREVAGQLQCSHMQRPEVSRVPQEHVVFLIYG